MGVSAPRARGDARSCGRRSARCGRVGARRAPSERRPRVSGVNARLRQFVDGLSAKTLVVVGDLICDEYLYGKPARISREAPVLILRFTEREVSLDGAANAAHNVHALGARVLPVGVVGRDAAGDELLGLFHASGIPTYGIVTENGRTTPARTRSSRG